MAEVEEVEEIEKGVALIALFLMLSSSSASAKVTFQLPTADSTIATNSYLPIIWTYNELVLDYIDLYLLPVNSFNSLVPLAVRQAVAAGSTAWSVPRSFTEGYYWIVATHTADETFQVIGSTPEATNTVRYLFVCLLVCLFPSSLSQTRKHPSFIFVLFSSALLTRQRAPSSLSLSLSLSVSLPE